MKFSPVTLVTLVVKISRGLSELPSHVRARAVRHRSQPQCSNQSQQGIGMQSQNLRRVHVVAVGLFKRLQHQMLLVLLHRALKTRVRGLAMRFAQGNRKILGAISSVAPSTTARSIAFSSSRTLPGQSYCINRVSSLVRVFREPVYFSLTFAIKFCASSGISSRRSRNGASSGSRHSADKRDRCGTSPPEPLRTDAG